MKSSNNRNNDIWKVILMLLEVIILVGIVVILFTNSLHIRPEKFKVIAEIPIIYSKTIYESTHETILPIPLSKDQPNPPSFEEVVAGYVFDICKSYPNVDPYLVLSVIYQESRFIPNVSLGRCVGLMQISEYWHQDRAAKLGITDFWDPYSNILLGVDLLDELLKKTDGDVYFTLMLYNQTYSSARQMYSNGIISDYARDVVKRSNDYKEEYFNGSYSSSS